MARRSKLLKKTAGTRVARVRAGAYGSPARGMTRRPGGGDPQPKGEEALPQYIKRYCYGAGKLMNKPGYGSFSFPSQKQPGSVTVKKTMGNRVVVELINIHGKGGRITIMVDKCPPGSLG